MKRRVVVGLSGGVDSSVAALLLKQAGHDVVGVTMMIYSGTRPGVPGVDSCYSPGETADVEYAEGVCRTLGIPYHTVDLKKEFRASVLDYARSEYLAGRTPNPCIRCNQTMKFGLLLDRLSAGLEFDAFATGHYVQVFPSAGPSAAAGRFCIRKAADLTKDQSYFLCLLSQAQLSRVMFPLGTLAKTEVRKMAREAGLATHDRPESQDFAAGGYREVIEARDNEGRIVDQDGNQIGSHRGVWGYTIGQRKGLGVGGGEPLYVTRIDARTNTIVAGPESRLFKSQLTVKSVNWVSREAPTEPLRVGARIRYRNPEAPAVVTPLSDGGASVLFDEPQRAVAPGQMAAFYDGDILLGGGPIDV
ncbi:MAG TPA: tRNA 2-thiouridine(34) synthase MnmA [Spirochaetia bacterium]|nr:tRNA 2-thiouridine(34) synthase MnmA [Spirochaetia bacterium]